MNLKNWIPFIWFQIGVNVIGLPEVERHYEASTSYKSRVFHPGSKFHK